MKHLIIGTAGHVDHGKTTLIKALTGAETDRLKEEKERGISIDIGFASMQLGENIQAGIVDVPGHERFLKNMLAGTGGIDMAMLLIAADEGVMPQTREHLQMLSLFGVQHGIIVINKCDCVEEEWLMMVEDDVRQEVAGTFLEQAPLCLVSALKGTGIDRLRELLRNLAEEIAIRDEHAPFRLWIDRVFSIKGYGTVVTGSLLSGTVKAGDTLQLLPSGTVVKVRGVQNHFQKSDIAYAGQRTAINITGVEKEDLGRGMFLTQPGRGTVSESWDVHAKWLQEPPDSGTRIRMHLGTGEYLGRIHAYKDSRMRESSLYYLLMEDEVPAAAGDRGIVRLYSPQDLLGGVTFLQPCCKVKKISCYDQYLEQLCNAVMCSDINDLVSAVIGSSRDFLLLDEIERASGYYSGKLLEQSVENLVQQGAILQISSFYVKKEFFMDLEQDLQDYLAKCHQVQVTRRGIAKDALRKKFSWERGIVVDEKVWETLVSYWQKKGEIVVIQGDIALPCHAREYESWLKDWLASVDNLLIKVDWEGVDDEWLAEKCGGITHARELLQQSNQLFKLGDRYLSTKTVDKLKQTVDKFVNNKAAQGEKATITVAELRDLINVSRKTSLALLELLDSIKFTERRGDYRVKCI